MGWEDAPVVQPAPKRAAWEDAPVVYPSAQPKAASGLLEAIQAGYQGSAPGLAIRGKLPEVQLSATDSKWYERAAAGAAQIASEFPLMVAGGIGGGAAGTAVGGPVGSLIGAGAGAFAVPAAIRESYIQAYSKGEITSTADFLDRASIVLKHTGKEAAIGAATAGAGKLASVGAQAAGLGAKATVATTLTAEAGTLTVAPALLEGRMPEPQDFVDAAVLLVGLKGATVGAKKLADIYAKTGKTPVEVVADAKRDPTIVEDIKGDVTAVEPSTAKAIEPTKATEPAYDPEARVSVQAFDAETGAMAETTMTAKQALADNAKRRDQMEGLLKCLGA